MCALGRVRSRYRVNTPDRRPWSHHQRRQRIIDADNATLVPSRMQSSGVSALAASHAHAAGVAEPPDHHRDPFDRILVAQALAEGVPILSSDPQLDRYDSERIDAS
jgi:PIN domain nuclease of toxin-antitoxin system